MLLPEIPVQVTYSCDLELLKLLERAEILLAECQHHKLTPCDTRTAIRKYFSDHTRGVVVNLVRTKCVR